MPNDDKSFLVLWNEDKLVLKMNTEYQYTNVLPYLRKKDGISVQQYVACWYGVCGVEINFQRIIKFQLM